MTTTQFVFAWVAYIAVTFGSAGAWHLGLFKQTYDRLGMFTRQQPIIWLGLASMVIQGAVMAYVYPRFYAGGSPIMTGALFGLLMGLFMGSNAVLAEAGKNEVASLRTWILLEGAFYLVWPVLFGMTIGLVYGQLAA
jgi:hypothetical protein